MTKKIKWSIDQSHSQIGFKIRHLMITNVRGEFKEFEARIYTTAQDFETLDVNLWINADSISTGDEKRDEHLKSPDFFDVEQYRQITFTSTKNEKTELRNQFQLTGELSIKGITKSITLNLELGGIIRDPWGSEKAGLLVSGKLNRKDWGLTWNTPMESGGLLLSDEINISCELELSHVHEQDSERIRDLTDQNRSSI